MTAIAPFRKTFGDNRLYCAFRFLLRPGLRIAFRAATAGSEHVPAAGPVLLVANHQSYIDPVLAGSFVGRVVDFVARDTLFANRAFGWLIRELNAFPIKRGHADIGSIKETLRRLKSGHAVMLFPEGTRTRDGRVAPLQAGVIALARRSDAPIVPCAIEGAYEIWPRSAMLPRPAKVWLEYGPPIAPDTWQGQSDDVAAAELTAILRNMHNKLRTRAGRVPFNYTVDDVAAVQNRATREHRA